MVAVKSNFKSQYGDNFSCQFCPEEESQSHLLFCKELTKGLDISGVEHEDIFRDISRQEKAAKVLNRILKQRDLKLKMLPIV